MPVDPSNDGDNDGESDDRRRDHLFRLPPRRIEARRRDGNRYRLLLCEENERDPRKSVEPVGQAVLTAVDLLRDGLGVALVGPAVQIPRVPVEQRHQAFPRIGVHRIRFLDEVQAIEPGRSAPVAELAIVVLAGELHAGTATVTIPVAILL
ncbi:hypothetical protein BWO90_08685 (plasmid) [Sinorhizobium meliloti]|nr:hypothetical protein BWO90_08685 [Sinorhizobium meliloti]